MTGIRVLLSKFTGLFRKARLEQQLDEDVRAHLEMLTEENLRRGMEPEEARYAALRQFGNVSSMKEECRETWSIRIVEELVQDIRYGLRQLRCNPGFTAVAVMTLALGIGATTALFSVVYCVFVAPFPYAHSHRLVTLVSWNKKVEGQFGAAQLSASELEDYRKQNHVFDDVAGSTFERVLVTGIDLPESWIGSAVTGNYFRLLGVTPLLGREITAQDDKAGAPAVAVLGYTVWQSTFGGDPKVLGRTLVLNQQPATIIGVMPRRFGGKVWISNGLTGTVSASGGVPFEMTARLKAGVSLEQAQAEVAALSKRFASVYPKDHPPDMAFAIRRLDRDVRQFETPWLVLLGAVGLLLLIACVNLANLLLARARARERETAIRAALGATRRRLLRQFIIESLLLALSCAALGCLLAAGLVAGVWPILHSAFGYYIRPETVIRINGPVLLFTLGTAFLSTLLFGLAPALLATRSNIQGPLKASGRGTGEGRAHHRLRNALVVGEVALSLVLLTGAGLLFRSFWTLQHIKLGYNPDNVLEAFTDLLPDHYKTAEDRNRFWLEALRRVRALPGVVSATMSWPFMSYAPTAQVEIAGQSNTESQTVWFRMVDDMFFKTMGIPLLAGRPISEADMTEARPVAMVNRAFANKYFAGRNSLGAQVKLKPPDFFPPMKVAGFEIIGVVGDTVHAHGQEPKIQPQVFLPFTVAGTTWGMVFARTAGNPEALTKPIQSEFAALDKEQPVDAATNREDLRNWYIEPRFVMGMLTGFALLGMVLVCIGVYGVLSYAVAKRTQEIGVRMALGAQVSDVRAMVLKWGLRWLAIGIGIGIPASIVLEKILRNRIWGIKSADPLTLIAVSLVLTAVGLAACYIPARRASKVDPLVALRYE